MGSHLPDYAETPATLKLSEEATWPCECWLLADFDECACALQSKDKRFKLIPSRWHVILKVRQVSGCKEAIAYRGQDIGLHLLALFVMMTMVSHATH